MQNKKLLNLLILALFVPMFIHTSPLSESYIFDLIRPVLLANLPFTLVGMILFILIVLIESTIVSKITKIAYDSSFKYIFLAKLTSFLINAVITIIFMIGIGRTFCTAECVEGSELEQLNFFTTKTVSSILPVWLIMLLFTKITVDYIFLHRIATNKITAMHSIIVANLTTYSLLLLMCFISDYFNLSLVDRLMPDIS